jgi:hypothetical protein
MGIKDRSGNQNNLTNFGGAFGRASYGGNRSILVDETILTDSTMLVINNEEYEIFSYQPLKLNDNFSFQAILKKVDKSNVPSNAM